MEALRQVRLGPRWQPTPPGKFPARLSAASDAFGRTRFARAQDRHPVAGRQESDGAGTVAAGL